MEVQHKNTNITNLKAAAKIEDWFDVVNDDDRYRTEIGVESQSGSRRLRALTHSS